MEKETKALKVVLNIFNTYLEKTGCDMASFEADSYSHRLTYGNKFYCGSKGPSRWVGAPHSNPMLNSPIPIDRFIEDFLDALDGNNELPSITDTPNGGDTEYYAYEFEIYPKNRMVTVYGYFSYYVEGAEEENFYDTDELPEDILKFLEELDENGHKELEVNCTGGGDSGFVEDSGSTIKDDYYQIPDVVENYCYQLLERYPGWEINEGSQSMFYFDGTKRTVSFTFSYNEEVNDKDSLYQLKY